MGEHGTIQKMRAKDMLKFKFDEQKAMSIVLYIAEKLISLNDRRAKPDLHKIFKVLYFADQKHLARYGRLIVGDFYIAMDHGPVPSNIYDMIKTIRGDSIYADDRRYGDSFKVRDHFVYPKHEPDLGVLSESDIECINEALQENQYLSFAELRDKSHDSAYCKATKDDKISFRAMAKIGGADNEMLSYIQTTSENERLLSI